MQKMNYQAKDWNNGSCKSLVRKFKLAMVSTLLLIVVVWAGIMMPFQAAASHVASVSSRAQAIIIQITPSGVCNPGPNC